MKLPEQVRAVILEYGMIRPKDHVILGLSGGADSVCLLLCLAKLRAELDYSLCAVHVHHGIRGAEADRDAAFAENLCRKLEVPFRVVYVDVPGYVREHSCSAEEAGRILRYEAFREEKTRWVCEGTIRIALAHHQDDQAETVLLNLCRGTGIRGLGGIPAVHEDRIRPLIRIRRKEILAWLMEQGQEWCEDSTNQENDYTRNRIRHEILPALEAGVNERSVEHMAALAEQAAALDQWLETEAQTFLAKYLLEEEGEWRLPKDPLLALPVSLRDRVWQRFLEGAAGAARNLTARHLAALEDLLQGDSGRSRNLLCEVVAIRRRDCLVLKKRAESENAAEACDVCLRIEPDMDREIVLAGRTWRIQTGVRAFSGEKIPENRYTKWFDYDKITWSMQLRTRRSGDCMTLAGVGNKKVNRYMIDAGIPAEWRDGIPLLVDGEHEVCWVVGYRMSARYQIGEETRRILVVTMEPDSKFREV